MESYAAGPAPAASLTPTPDLDTLAAFELALRLHEGRYLVMPRIATVPAPAAGADWSYVCSEGSVSIILGVTATFATSATVATRAPGLVISDGTTRVGNVPPAVVPPASQTWAYSWMREAGYAAQQGTGGTAIQSFPRWPLPGGFVVASSTVAIQVGDQWSAIALYLLELSERQYVDRAQEAVEYARGAHADLYPGYLLGL